MAVLFFALQPKKGAGGGGAFACQPVFPNFWGSGGQLLMTFCLRKQE
jgi:hypothetical protein